MAKGKVTPVGIASYPHLQRPDTKFKEEGEYRVTLRFPKDSPFCDALRKECQEVWDEYRQAEKYKNPKKAPLPAEPKYWPYTESEEGFDVKFKTSAQFKDKKTGEIKQRKVALFDKFKQPVTEDLSMGNGSTMRIDYTAQGSSNGPNSAVTLYINAVQIATVVKYEGAANSFDELEEGDDLGTAGAEGSTEAADDGDSSF